MTLTWQDHLGIAVDVIFNDNYYNIGCAISNFADVVNDFVVSKFFTCMSEAGGEFTGFFVFPHFLQSLNGSLRKEYWFDRVMSFIDAVSYGFDCRIWLCTKEIFTLSVASLFKYNAISYALGIFSYGVDVIRSLKRWYFSELDKGELVTLWDVAENVSLLAYDVFSACATLAIYSTFPAAILYSYTACEIFYYIPRYLKKMAAARNAMAAVHV